jgi:hypothetical protein
VGVPALEVALAVALLISPAIWLPLVMLSTAGLFSVFTVWLGWVYTRKLQLSCGCFGSSTQPVNLHTIGRNVVLLGVAGCGMILSANILSLLPSFPAVVVVSAVLIGFSSIVLLALNQNIPLSTTSALGTTTFVTTIAPRRRFLQRTLVGIAATVAATAGVGKAFAIPECGPCNCNYKTVFYNNDCKACAPFCTACPQIPCSLEVEFVTTKECCDDPGRICSTIGGIFYKKCC